MTFTEEQYRERVADLTMELGEYKKAIEILGRQNAQKDLEISRLKSEIGLDVPLDEPTVVDADEAARVADEILNPPAPNRAARRARRTS